MAAPTTTNAKMCIDFAKGNCRFAGACKFAHVHKPCSSWHKTGACSYGDACIFKHAEAVAASSELKENS